MLFVESKTLRVSIESAARLRLLVKLQEKGLTPLIRSARLSCYEQALLGPDRVEEMERAVSAWTEEEDDRAYILGDAFCFEDHVLYLVFGTEEDERTGVRAGIVYGTEMLEPAKKLDAFCRNVLDAMDRERTGAGYNREVDEEAQWEPRQPRASAVLGRFGAMQEGAPTESAAQRSEAGAGRGAELLEEIEARRLLHRISESQSDGRMSEILSGTESEAATASLINRMSEAGLLRREVLISCRKTGRSLFRLPSPDALGVITASNAVCSECGTAIADEKIEDLVKPTDVASQLLEDGSWLTSRIRSCLREIGIPETQIAAAPTSDDGETLLMVNVSDVPFLFVLKDGDVTATQARHALARQIETEAAHLVVIASGKIQDEARVRLREHARRRARGGGDVEVILIEGVDVAEELRRAFERVSQRSLAGELSALDASLGLSVGFIVAARFKLMQRTGALKDLAESAVGALAGSLREF